MTASVAQPTVRDGPNAAGLVGQWLLNAGGPSAMVLLHFTVNLVVLIPIIFLVGAYPLGRAIDARRHARRR